MNLKEILNNDTAKAWEGLNQRLKEDGLLGLDINPKQPRIAHKKVIMWAASVAVLLIGAVSLLLMRNNEAIDVETFVLQNRQGEPTLVTTLEDGSTVFLSQGTSIEYPLHFTGEKREVHLDGDAFFEIARSEECPFVIETETVLIEVLGTSFSINGKKAASFSLSVRSGEVRVTSKLTGESLHVKAGQTALLQKEKIQTIATVNPDDFQSYFDKIYFKDLKLGSILRIANERNKGSMQILCAHELVDRKLNVVLSDESPLEFAEIICAGLDLNYYKEKETIYITSNSE